VKLAIVWLLAALLAAPAAAQEGIDDPAIDRGVKAHAERSKGAEHRNSRRAVVGDLNADGTSDVAVLYTIEGTKGASVDFLLRYLAVFRRGDTGLAYEAHRLVGGKGIREVNRVAILKGVIVLESLEYQPRDPVCCPSKPGRWRYRLRGHELTEVKSAPPAAAKAAPEKKAKQ
jgi:hypothetical protein